MWRIIAAALLATWLPSGCAAAGKRPTEWTAAARTAFCWPLAEFRYSLNRPTGGWLAPRGRNSQHLGVDMFAPVGRPVRAIADGVVHDISTSGWGGGNVAIMVRHQLADGRWFIALYGHIRNSTELRKGSRVQGCRTIGVIGSYRAGSHVHLGVISPGRLPHAPYGTSKRGDHNNFIDPVQFLGTGLPEAGGCARHAEDEEQAAAPESPSDHSEPTETKQPEAATSSDSTTAQLVEQEQQVEKKNKPLLQEPKVLSKKARTKKAAVTKTKKSSRKRTAAKRSSSSTKKATAKQTKRTRKKSACSAKKSPAKKTPVLKGGSKRSVSARGRKR